MSEVNTYFMAEVYRAARMGNETISTVISKVNDSEMRNELLREQEAFQEVERKALRSLNENEESPLPVKKMQEMWSYIGIKANTLIDSSPSHIADLMIQGNNMGIIGITKTKNNHYQVGDYSSELADDLVGILQDNIDKLLPYLK